MTDLDTAAIRAKVVKAYMHDADKAVWAQVLDELDALRVQLAQATAEGERHVALTAQGWHEAVDRAEKAEAALAAVTAERDEATTLLNDVHVARWRAEDRLARVGALLDAAEANTSNRTIYGGGLAAARVDVPAVRAAMQACWMEQRGPSPLCNDCHEAKHATPAAGEAPPAMHFVYCENCGAATTRPYGSLEPGYAVTHCANCPPIPPHEFVDGYGNGRRCTRIYQVRPDFFPECGQRRDHPVHGGTNG